MDGTVNDDMWTPFKELLTVVEGAVANPVDAVLDQLEKYLQKHKQNFYTLLKNPPKNAKNREHLQKSTTEGISLPGMGHQTLPQELVDEALIISDMYDLNEYMALDLLCTAHQQMPYHPGLTRGLVAVLLYYDGKKALITALRVLVQARQGNLWAVDCHADVSNYITNYTNELLANGLISKILKFLDTLDLSKEMELLQKNRALGGPKHHHQIVDIYQGVRQALADIVFLWSAQSGLPKQATLELIGLLQHIKCQEDNVGGIDNVVLALEMALLYAIDVSILHKRQEGEELVEKLPLLEESGFITSLLNELSCGSKEWEYPGIHALTQFAWGVTLATLRMAPPSLQPPGLVDEDDVLVDAAVDAKVFNFLHTSFLLNETIYKEEFYLRRIHCLLTDFIALMPLKVKELRNRADEAAKTIQAYVQEGLNPPASLPHCFEDLLLSLAKLYDKDPLNLNLELEFWCTNEGCNTTSHPYRTPPRQVPLFKFVRQSGDLLPATLFVPYMKMLSSLSSCQKAARECFNFLKMNSLNTVNWDHFFNSFSMYYSNLRQEWPPPTDTVYRHRGYSKGITLQEIHSLLAVLGVIKTVAEHDEVSRVELCENLVWAPLSVLLGLVSCCIQIPLKAELLLTLAALAKSPDTAATLWNYLEASQILVTVPSTSSYQPRGIETELEEIESRNEEFPLTRAMLQLLNVLTDIPIPRSLGIGSRIPGFNPYLTFIIESVLLRFNSRSYKYSQEKWEICQSSLKILVKLLEKYEPQPEDFLSNELSLKGGVTSQVNPPPGYHIMVQLCSKSELLRLILFIIDEGCSLLATFAVFPGKAQLEASTGSCLQLLDTALNLQQKFIMILNNLESTLLLTPLNKLLLGVNPRSGKPDHLLNITKYVTYNSWLPNHALSSVKILLCVTSYPTPQSHIISVFTSTPYLKTHIRHGFVECLEADPDDTIVEENFDEEVGVVGQTKEVICKLILQCLNHSQPNISHYLLGFDLNKDVKQTIFQQPGVHGFPRTCLHSVLTLLSTSLQARNNPTVIPPHPKLIELCYRLIYSLTANPNTYEPILRFLRWGEFLQKHLIALPFKSENKESNLNQMSWLLKTVAIELKVTASQQHLSQFSNLINVLVSQGSKDSGADGDVPMATPVLASQLTSAFSNNTVSKNPLNQQLILRLLRDFNFFVDPVLSPDWNMFEGKKINQVIKECEASVGSGLRLIDIKVLHKILVEELTAAAQGSSTANQRALITEDIQNILKYALKLNQHRKLVASTTHFLDAWRQVTEVMFAVASSDTLPFESRFCLLLEILHELLEKVLTKNNVVSEMVNLSSGAVLLLFVDLRNCYVSEQSKVSAGGIESTNRLSALIYSRENILKNIMSSIIKWILSSGVASQKIKANLYASLLNFLHMARQQSPLFNQSQELDNSRFLSTFSETRDFTVDEESNILGSRNVSLEVLAGFGENLVIIMCHDCSGGHDLTKMLALSCLLMMIELDPHGTWISFLSKRGYLKFIIDNILESDEQLCKLLSPALDTLRPLYVYESKMALLCRVASTLIGAELLMEQNALSCLSAMQIFDKHPDITATVSQRKANLSDLEYIPSINSRYLQILSPALTLCETVLSSLGVENDSAVVKVLYFLLSHGDTVSMVLRSGSPYLPLCFLEELSQLTSVVARATNIRVRKQIAEQCEEPTNMLETTSHFYRIEKLMLALLGQFIVTDTVLKDVANAAEQNKPQEKGKAVNCFLQIVANLVLYARNLVVSTGVDRRVTQVVLQPTLLDPLVTDRPNVTFSGEASLGLIVQLLVQCVKHYHIEKDSLDFLTQHLHSVSDMNTTNVKEFLPDEISSYSALDECRQQAGQVLKTRVSEKVQELQLYSFIIEHCLYLLWSHLDYYMLRAIPNKMLGIDNASMKGKSTQMCDVAWSVSVNEINHLKQGLISVLNDSFCKNLISTTQEKSSSEKGFVEALLRRIKKLIQFVPSE